jgi:hypothetical protein
MVAKEKKETEDDVLTPDTVHGQVEKVVHAPRLLEGHETPRGINGDANAARAAEDLVELMDEINNRVSNGTANLLRDLTQDIDEKLVRLPEKSANELTSYMYDLAEKIQLAQATELERQLAELDRRFLRPLEALAFSDVPLLEPKSASLLESEDDATDMSRAQRDDLILMGANSTLGATRRMRTKDILRNFNVAPLYYSMALLVRWVGKASYPSIYLLSLYRTLASERADSQALGRPPPIG